MTILEVVYYFTTITIFAIYCDFVKCDCSIFVIRTSAVVPLLIKLGSGGGEGQDKASC